MTSKFALLISIILFASLWWGCSDEAPTGDNAPVLTYEGFAKDQMFQGDGTDSIVVLLSFMDVDADIRGGNTGDITVIDNRDGSEYITLSFPPLPTTSRQEGSLVLIIPNTCCIYPPDANTPACDMNPRFPTNEFTLDISIVDSRGNQSNVITTDDILLNCLL
ncbi:MAG: hypothetical protein AAFR14_04040 [Bacteroidota bacterium]